MTDQLTEADMTRASRTEHVAFQFDAQALAECYRFAIRELEFMHPDVMTDNVLRRGAFAPGGPGDPLRHLLGRKA